MTPDRSRNLWSLTRGERFRYSSGIAAMGLGILFLMLVPLVARAAIDGLGGGAHPAWLSVPAEAAGLDPLWIAAAAVVLLTMVGGSFQYVRSRCASIASEAITRRLRNTLYSHLEDLPCSYHDRAETGDLVQRCSSDVETLRVFLSGQVIEIARSILLLVVVIPLMLSLDGRLTLLSVLLMPVILALAIVFFRKVRRLFKLADEAEGRMTSVLQENLTGIRVVRAFARQDHEREKFGARNVEFRDRNYRLLNVLGRYWAFSDLLCMGQIGITLFAGAGFLIREDVSLGTFVAFNSYIWYVIWPVRHLGRVLTDTGKALVSLGRIKEILAVDPEPDLEESGAEEPERLRGRIEFEDVTFAFGEEPVLHDVSFRVEPGETLAILGPQGSGKSTILNLLLRLYDYGEGSIRLDGLELRTLSRRFVRSRIGVVLQEPFLYAKAIGANVRLGRSGASEEELVESTTSACVHDAIAAFDDGYETVVGERGVTLSGGQRQRVALARALLKDPDVLVLDDALSAVDTSTEARILEALERRRGRTTTIIVSHRLSSVVSADRTLVMDHGRVVQAGTHAALLEEEGPYRRLWRIQGALEKEIAGDLARTSRDRKRRSGS